MLLCPKIVSEATVSKPAAPLCNFNEAYADHLLSFICPGSFIRHDCRFLIVTSSFARTEYAINGVITMWTCGVQLGGRLRVSAGEGKLL
jgi:hypothetical protein